MSAGCIFEFSDPTRYVQTVFEIAKKGNPGWSVRAWARRMRQRNPAMLAAVLSGKRRLTAEWVERIAGDLRLTAEERRYFHLLVKARQATSPTEQRLFEELLLDMRGSTKDQVFPIDQFRVIADWYHLAMLELAHIPGFKADPAWLRARLRPATDLAQLQQALDRLARLGLLKSGDDGKVRRFSVERILIDPKRRADAARKFHSQMLAHASAALEELEVDQRFFQGSMVPLTRAGYEELCGRIASFQKQACRLGSQSEGAEVYFVGTQLIPLTQGDQS